MTEQSRFISKHLFGATLDSTLLTIKNASVFWCKVLSYSRFIEKNRSRAFVSTRHTVSVSQVRKDTKTRMKV